MTELLLHMNNYSITGAITAYQMYPKFRQKQTEWDNLYFLLNF